jgi:UDP-2,3-diacylglucosamine pyrophosphatase LpxH
MTQSERASRLPTLIISDVHLGSPICRAEDLCRLLEVESPGRLIINGDLLDHYDFRTFGAPHWRLLSTLRELSRRIEVVWVLGNHDMQKGVQAFAQMLNVRIAHAYRWEQFMNGITIECLALHGHQFDAFMLRNPLVSAMADTVYRWIQQNTMVTRRVLKYLKKSSKQWIRNSISVREGAFNAAKEAGAGFVCCGHTHAPEVVMSEERDVVYMNSGDWVHEATYIRVDDDGPMLLTWSDATTGTPGKPGHLQLQN